MRRSNLLHVRYVGPFILGLCVAGATVALSLSAAPLPQRIYTSKINHPAQGATLFSRMNSRAGVYTFKTHRTLALNGYESLQFAATRITGGHETIVGLLPAVYSGQTNRALVIGAGSGTTAAAVASQYRHVTIVDLDPNAPALLNYFATANSRVLNQPHVRLIPDNALSFLMRSPRRYDAIVSTPTVPSYAGANQVYTRAYFQAAATHLAPDGVFTLWFDIRETRKGIETIFRTLRTAFPYVTGFRVDRGYFELIGSKVPLQEIQRDIRAHLTPEQSRDVIALYLYDKGSATTDEMDHFSIPDWLAGWVFDGDGPLPQDSAGPINTLNTPRLQYSTQISTRPNQGGDFGRMESRLKWLDASSASDGEPQ